MASGEMWVGGARHADISRLGGIATTFRDNDYLRVLNKVLRSERRLVFIYSALTQDLTSWQQLLEHHQKAVQRLIVIITTHRGLPDTTVAPLSRVAARVCRSRSIAYWDKRASLTRRILYSMEATLLRDYIALHQMAPQRDMPDLEENERSIELCMEVLRRGDISSG